jgi:hypothetical protein
VAGAGVDYKRLLPRLVTTSNQQTDATVGSLAGLVFAKVDAAPWTFKAEGVIGDNLADLLMIGGYAAERIDSVSGSETYTPMGCYAAWAEVIYGKELEFAVFAGYTRNLGASADPIGPLFARASDIAELYRIAPRVQWTSGSMRLSTELEYTAVAYGTPNRSNRALVEDTRTLANLRLLAAVWYFF